MLVLDLSNCGPPDILRVIYFLKILLNFVLFIVPIGLVVFLSLDFGKAMISGDDSTQKKSVQLAIKRILYTVVLFCVPTIVSFVNDILGDLGVNYSVCYENLTMDEIDYLSSIEFSCEEADKYVAIAEKELTSSAIETAQNYIDNVLDEEKKIQLQNRLEIAKENAKNKPKEDEQNSQNNPKEEGQNSNYNGISSSGTCVIRKVTVLKVEPDPSCALNYWKKYIDVDNFFYPAIDGKKLGAWPKNYANIPAKLSSTKKYQNNNLIWPTTPTNGKYTFVYQHNGIDIMAPLGTPIYAPASGKLRYSEWGHTANKGTDETAYSVTIILDTPIMYKNEKYNTIFLTHMSGIINRCPNGSCNLRVEQGELIGFVGNAAGDAVTVGYAPHLHMTIYPTANGYSGGLKTTSIQELYNLNCGTSCKNVEIKAGG